jgi:hypothetical protein
MGETGIGAFPYIKLTGTSDSSGLTRVPYPASYTKTNTHVLSAKLLDGYGFWEQVETTGAVLYGN